MEQDANALAAGSPLRAALLGECASLRQWVAQLLGVAATQADLVGAIAYPFLQWLGVVAGAWQWAIAAGAAARDPAGAATRATLDHAEFYAAHILPRARALALIVAGGSDIIGRAQL